MIRKLLASLAIAATLNASSALAQSLPAPHASAGAGQYGTVITTAQPLTVPSAFAGFARICVEGQAARWRDDGTAPTTAVGMPVPSGTCFDYAGPLAAFQIISTTAGGTIDVVYYR